MDIEQRIAILQQHPALQPILHHVDQALPALINQAITIQQIPAPTFEEHDRARYVLDKLQELGLQEAHTDIVHNAAGKCPGTDPNASAVLISAHTDTVFPRETSLLMHYEGRDRIYGPGLGDNSLGVAGLLTLAEIFHHFQITPRRPVWFLANSREEGLGDLGGIRAFHTARRNELNCGIVLEGLALGRIFHEGIAVKRLHIQVFAGGGHSWQHFGRPSAIHQLLALGTRIVALDVPQEPRTTYNIGLISGGQSVNSLASQAGLYLDMRSEETATLAALEAEVRAIVDDIARTNGITTSIEVVGDRPAGSVSPDHELVRGAVAALSAVGIEARHETGSTDANWLLAQGLPTVTLGLTTGSNAHRLDEFIDCPPISLGMRQLVLLALAAAEWEPRLSIG